MVYKNNTKIEFVSYHKLKDYAFVISLVLFLFILPLLIQSPYFFHVLNITLIYIISTSSLRTIALSGQLSLAHASFMGVGAYTSSIIAIKLGITPWITIPLGGIAAMVCGVLVGYPLTRLRAIYFAMVSLFFGMAIVALIGVFHNLTGGDIGLIFIPPLPSIQIPKLGSIVFAGLKINYYLFHLAVAILSLLVLYRIENSRTGVCWKAVAQSHLVASSVGISEVKFRLFAIAVGCFFSGIAGSCYAHYFLALTRGSFGFLASVNLLIYLLLGGRKHFSGPIIGTAVLLIVPEIFRFLREFTPFIYGGIIIVVTFLMPQGLSGLIRSTKSKSAQFL